MKSVFTYLLLQWLALASAGELLTMWYTVMLSTFCVIYYNIIKFVILLPLKLNATALGSDGLEVTITQNGTATAGGTSFSLSCCVTLPQWMKTFEELNILQFITPDTVNDRDYRVITMEDSVTDTDCANTSVLQFTTLKTSHGGEYTCRAARNASFITAENITTVKCTK